MLSAEQPDLALAIPAAYRDATTTSRTALPKTDWWLGFRSRELTRLIEEAQIGNLDIAAAIARVIQADAQARVAGAVLVPAISFGGSASRTRSSQATGTRLGATGGPSVRNQFSAVFSASYELDFWGKNRATLRAAEQNAVATRFEREVVALTTMAAVANAYFPGARRAGPAALCAREYRLRQPRAHRDQAAPGGRDAPRRLMSRNRKAC